MLPGARRPGTVLVCGLLQRFQRSGIEEKGHDADEGDALAAALAVDGREHLHDTDINRVVAPNEFVVYSFHLEVVCLCTEVQNDDSKVVPSRRCEAAEVSRAEIAVARNYVRPRFRARNMVSSFCQFTSEEQKFHVCRTDHLLDFIIPVERLFL